MSAVLAPSPGPDLEKGVVDGEIKPTRSASVEEEPTGRDTNTDAGLPNQSQSIRGVTHDACPATPELALPPQLALQVLPPQLALSSQQYDTRSTSPTPSAISAQGTRKTGRSFPSRPGRAVRRTRRAPSISSSRATSRESSLRRQASSPGPSGLSNFAARGRASRRVSEVQVSPGYSPPARPLSGGEQGTVTLHPQDAVNQGRWVVDHHRKELIREVVGTQQESAQWFRRVFGMTEPAPQERIFRVSFAEMQRMKLRKLQVKLVDHAVGMVSRNEESEGWEEDLERYTQAMRDYDYMLECTKLPNDYFYATGERAVDRYIIRRLVMGDFDRLGKARLNTPIELWEKDGENKPIGGTRNLNVYNARSKAFWERLNIAAIGGVLLLGPMWLMMLHGDLYTRLITTTVCVAFLGLLASWRLEKADQVLQATAAYAAVLVVFVGLTTSSS